MTNEVFVNEVILEKLDETHYSVTIYRNQEFELQVVKPTALEATQVADECLGVGRYVLTERYIYEE